MDNIDEAKRFILKYSEVKGDCLVFTGPTDGDGYGMTNIKNKSWRIHRVMAHVYGKLDLEDTSRLALHIVECPNKNCFKEEHLYAGTFSNNRQDVLAKRPDPKRILCRQGHKLEGDNVIKNNRGERLCKICYDENNKRNNLKKKAEAIIKKRFKK